jgi:hypothetical protein
MEVTINTFAELVDFIEETNLTPGQTAEIVQATIGAYYTNTAPKQELLTALVEWWERYEEQQEKPIFIRL